MAIPISIPPGGQRSRGNGRFRVYYPSGHMFEIEGVLAIVDLSRPGENGGPLSLMVDTNNDELHALDPRAVVTDGKGTSIYWPGLIVDDPRFDDNMRQALRETPQWPPGVLPAWKPTLPKNLSGLPSRSYSPAE